MKATGIVRYMDDLGRVAIPKDLRKRTGITEGDAFEIFVTTDKQIIMQKYHEEEPEKNGLKADTFKEEEYRKATIRDTGGDNKTVYLNLSKSAWDLLFWLESEGFFHYDVSISEGHDITTEDFLEKGD